MIQTSLLDLPDVVEGIQTAFNRRVFEIRAQQTEQEREYVIRLLQARESWKTAGNKGILSGHVLRLYRQEYKDKFFTDTTATPDTEWIREVTAFVLTDYILHGNDGIFHRRFVFLMLHEIATPRVSILLPQIFDARKTAKRVVEKIPGIDEVLKRLIGRMNHVYDQLQYGDPDKTTADFLTKIGKALSVDPRPLRISRAAAGFMKVNALWRQEITKSAQTAAQRLENILDSQLPKTAAR